jgi:hypothetical protein
MAASVSGSKTVTQNASPILTATLLTTLLAIPVESLTVLQFNQIRDALRKTPKGGAPNLTIGSILL